MAHSSKWKYMPSLGVASIATVWLVRSVRKANQQTIALRDAKASPGSGSRVATVWLVRPPETCFDDTGTLSDHGVEEITSVGVYLKSKLDPESEIQLLTSSVPRACETAKILSQQLGVNLRTRPWLQPAQDPDHEIKMALTYVPDLQLVLVTHLGPTTVMVGSADPVISCLYRASVELAA
jgi:phosphohistidine phosphatase SixA